MREIDAQSLVIQSVRNAGGAAHKLSNRFMIGVSDLLIKLPSRPALLAECKMQHIANSTKPDHEFKLDVTTPQVEFLSKYGAAGMATCVLSFIERGGLGRRGLSAGWFKLDKLILRRYYVPVGCHVEIPLSTAGENVLLSLLEEATYN